jgi:hypothetical protein
MQLVTFGTSVPVLDEGVVVEWLWPVDPEFHEYAQDPLVAFLDDPRFTENRLVQDNVMRVGVIGHEAPPFLWIWFLGGWVCGMAGRISADFWA